MKNKKGVFILSTVILFFILAGCTQSGQVFSSTMQGSATTSTSATPAATTAAILTPIALDGKTIMEEKCQSCHSLAPIYNTQQSADGWTQIVNLMISRGALLSADEQTVLIQYLAANYK